MSDAEQVREVLLGKLVPCEHLYYMAPLSNAAVIRVLGIYSYNRIQGIRENPDLRGLLPSIADPMVNRRRHRRPLGTKTVHDFVPFYWATHTPMQYVVTVKEDWLPQDQLVFFLCDSVTILHQDGVWTTDGNAANNETQRFEAMGALQHLDHRIIHTRNCYSKEYKRKKMAEVLVPDHVERELIKLVAVRRKETQEALDQASTKLARAMKVRKADLAPIEVHREYYYVEYE